MRICKEGKIDTRNTTESADSMDVLSLGEGCRRRTGNSFTITYAEGHCEYCVVGLLDEGISIVLQIVSELVLIICNN